VQLWAQGQNLTNVIPSGSTGQSFSIISPQNGASMQAGMPMSITAAHPAPQNVQQINYFLNDMFVGGSNQAPYGVTVSPIIRGPAILKAIATTPMGTETTQVQITIQ
jgi:hypothetical protein